MKSNTYYIYREAATKEELKALLHLRYRVYRESRLASFVDENTTQLDIDSFDTTSRHFGLFAISGNRNDPIGYMRVIQHISQGNDLISEILTESDELREKVDRLLLAPFPSMTYCEAPQVLRTYVQRQQEKGRRVCEASRFLFKRSINSLKLAKFVIKASIAIYGPVLNYDRAIICCSRSHVPIYYRFGFEEMAGTVPFKVNRTLLQVLKLSLDSIEGNPTYLRNPSIINMAKAYEQTGRICFYPDRPDVFLPPTFLKTEPASGMVTIPSPAV
jgi:N-acyl-L-homoserine lactone synthetase